MSVSNPTAQAPSQYACVMCKQWPSNPYLAYCCGQQFCKACLTGPEGADPVYCPCCETGGADFEYMPYKTLREEIDNALVHCSCKASGCDMIMRREEWPDHEKECGYFVVDCNKCNGHMLRKYSIEHARERCPLREVVCPHCNITGTFKDITGSHQEICLGVKIKCPNNCGDVFKRSQTASHLSVCPESERLCPFAEAGCKEKIKYRDFDKHLNEATQEHMVMLISAYLSVKQELQELKQSILIT